MSEHAKVELGKLAPPEAMRDAVHVAVVPVVVGKPWMFQPGDEVAIEQGEAVPVTPLVNTAIGIVDPFLNHPVRAGERFWLFLKPGTITGMRHHWEHPAFPDSMEQPAITANTIAKAVSMAWMEAWCDEKQAGPVSEFLIALPSGKWCFGEDDYPYNWSDFPNDFWKHYKVLTGRDKPTVEANFRCAC